MGPVSRQTKASAEGQTIAPCETHCLSLPNTPALRKAEMKTRLVVAGTGENPARGGCDPCDPAEAVCSRAEMGEERSTLTAYEPTEATTGTG